MSKSLIALLATVAATALVVAGCGGSSDSTGTTGSLTKAEFVKQGNAICAEGAKELEEGFEEFAKEHNFSENKQPTKAELTEASEEILIPGVRKQIEGIRDLGLPSEDGEEADEALEAAEKALEEGEEDPAAMATEDSGPFAKANKLAKEFGLTKCGEE